MKMSASGGQAVELPSGVGGSPQISPDGTTILCVIFDEKSQPNRNRPALVSLDDGHLIRFLDLPVTAGGFRWSPDGRDVLFSDTKGEVGNVWSQPLAGGPFKQLTKFTTGFLTAYAISPDGKTIAVARVFGRTTLF